MAHLADTLDSFEHTAGRLKRERDLLLERRSRWLAAAKIVDPADVEKPDMLRPEGALAEWPEVLRKQIANDF